MSQLTIRLSDKADALVAQLQKEIFQRRRKKVSPEGVIETLVESGAKSQSDKRFATSWKNLVSDIEKAARLAEAHGAKPAVLSDEEWALVLTHRSRNAPGSPAATPRRKTAAAPVAGRKTARTAEAKTTARKKGEPKKAVTVKTAGGKKPVEEGQRTPAAAAGSRRVRSSVAKRMAKAVNRLGSGALVTPTGNPAQDGPAGNGTAGGGALLS